MKAEVRIAANCIVTQRVSSLNRLGATCENSFAFDDELARSSTNASPREERRTNEDGASGQIGRAVGERFLRDGWHVTLAQRGEALPELIELGAASVSVDREEPGALRKAIGDGADVLVDAIAFHDGHANGLLEIEDVVKHFVVISSASVYRDDRGRTLDEARGYDDLPEMPVPIDESQPTVAPGPQTYSTKKIALERIVLDRSTSVVTIVRPCAIFGPNSKHPREWWFVKRMLDDRRTIPLQVEDNGFQTSATVNIAGVVATAIDAAFTGILNAGDPDAPTVREIGEIIAREFSWDGTFVRTPETADVGSTPWSLLHPFVLSTEAAVRLGYRPVTTYREFCPPTCRWLVEAVRANDWRTAFPVLLQYPDLFDYDAEDSYVRTLP